MAKLDALKEKISGLKAKLREKLDKIAFFRKRGEATAAAPSKPSPGIGQIYKQGSTGTRLHVILVFVLALASLAATVHAARKMLKHFGKSAEHEQLAKDYSHGFEELSQKAADKARLIALGTFTSVLSAGGEKKKMMSLDVWARVSDPDTADYLTKNDAIVRDRVIEALGEIAQQPVDPLSEPGKEFVKSKVTESLNNSLAKGKVEEVFFQNLIVQ